MDCRCWVNSQFVRLYLIRWISKQAGISLVIDNLHRTADKAGKTCNTLLSLSSSGYRRTASLNLSACKLSQLHSQSHSRHSRFNDGEIQVGQPNRINWLAITCNHPFVYCRVQLICGLLRVTIQSGWIFIRVVVAPSSSIDFRNRPWRGRFIYKTKRTEQFMCTLFETSRVQLLLRPSSIAQPVHVLDNDSCPTSCDSFFPLKFCLQNIRENFPFSSSGFSYFSLKNSETLATSQPPFEHIERSYNALRDLIT